MPTQTFFNISQEKRDRIIDATIEEFLAHPYEKASICRITEKAGIAKGSYYQYFENKDDLYMYCHLLIYRQVMEAAYGRDDEPFSSRLQDILAVDPTDSLQEYIELVGERRYRFVRTALNAPPHVLNSILQQSSATFFAPLIRERLAMDDSIHSGVDYDFYSFLLSMNISLLTEYGRLKGLTFEQLDGYSVKYVDILYQAILKDSEELYQKE